MKRFLLFFALLCAASLLPSKAQNVNYDENAVGPYTLEDPLVFVDGTKVKSAKDWDARRNEILEIFQKEMYGRMPQKSGIWLETLEEGTTLAGFASRKQVRMWFRPDKTGPKVDWLIVVPNHIQGPVPTILMLNYTGNQDILPDKEVLVTDGWLRNSEGITGHRATDATRGSLGGSCTDTTYPLGMLAARGYAFVTACYGEISPDPDKGEYGPDGKLLQDTFAYTGIFDLWGKRDESRDDNTTVLSAWAWVLMRAMDMIETSDELDESRVILTGYSRLGKAALIAGAFDERFPVVVPVQTGGGGIPLAKRNYGETVATEVASFRHWYCRAYDKYADNTDNMPFDQHLFISCVAPRALLVEGFDQGWFDTKGEFLSVKAASPVWKLLGKKGIPAVSWPEDHDKSAIGPYLGYVRRANKHGISALDWTWMMDFADGVFAASGK